MSNTPTNNQSMNNDDYEVFFQGKINCKTHCTCQCECTVFKKLRGKFPQEFLNNCDEGGYVEDTEYGKSFDIKCSAGEICNCGLQHTFEVSYSSETKEITIEKTQEKIKDVRNYLPSH